MITIDSAGAGDIISVAGLTSPSIGYTVAHTEVLTSYFSYSFFRFSCILFYDHCEVLLLIVL